jgi:hypothetical protein
MPGKPPGPLVLAITAALEHEGEATMAELAKIIGLHRFDCSSVVSRMRKPCKMLPKRIYVKRWVRDDDSGGRSYLRAVLALGDAPDAPKPKAKPNKESTAEYRAKERHRVNSVFMWAQPRRVREAARRNKEGA